jgi:phage FluMu gp28-like protein
MLAQVRIRMPHLHPAQMDVLKSDARFKVLACGRRWGKTRLATVMVVAEALRGKRAWWVAPSYKMGRVGWRLIKRLVKQLPFTCRVREDEHLIEMPTGGEVAVHSADDPDSLRGEGLDFVVLDECAYMKQETWYEVLRPALADRQGRAMFISTPHGRNWFYRLYHLAREHEHYDAWRFPTSANPFIRPEEISEAERSMPEMAFRQEYLAEFLDDAAGVFRGVNAVVDAGRSQNEPPEPGRQYVAGIDLARLQDFTVIVVFDENGRQVYFDRFNRMSWERQRQIIYEVHRRYHKCPCVIDASGVGDPIYQDLLRMGVVVKPVRFTNVMKEQIVEHLAMLIERGQVRLMDVPVQTEELLNFQYELKPSGRIRLQAPQGLHDDCVVALGLAATGIGAQVGYAESPFA